MRGALAWLGLLIAYMTWASLQAQYYAAGPYISPAYVPLLYVDWAVPGAPPVSEALLGMAPPAAAFVPRSPSFLIILMPMVFRGICYYHGETRPLLFRRLHLLTLLMSIGLLPWLAYYGYRGFFWDGELGIGIGSVVLVVNAALLTGYTLGCYDWRHLFAGRLDRFCCDGGGRAEQWAWICLCWFAFSDAYVRLVSMGIMPDVNTWRGGVTWVGAF